ncbi:hypothetical protein TraAM80_09063 [Trypanosoma rangeli]|uniref:Uncharacterized protein n=1 Tax=Trypanosoma rangeli TaxID=5698 RepID=A0A422MXI4_TRYRA|nr:uncharacterized protein TraAM80_09063 [Trypanosoma rangeli]RNE97917.1 hypothetical protein TraAM80_09063 [Trypanosoma rangeli]|eukprot:RNE97917.1 hypothetical protein TraAM80_09063 [Trypanosoma rangeli]
MTHSSSRNRVRPVAAGPSREVAGNVTYIRNETPPSFRVPPNGATSVSHEPFAGNGSIARRAAETWEWLKQMRKEVRQAKRKSKKEEKSASLLCSVLRASSAVLTDRAATRPSSLADSRRFRFALYSFLDGTPFLTPQSLCRYNTALAEALNDDQLELIRCHVFNYDEVAFADLLTPTWWQNH